MRKISGCLGDGWSLRIRSDGINPTVDEGLKIWSRFSHAAEIV